MTTIERVTLSRDALEAAVEAYNATVRDGAEWGELVFCFYVSGASTKTKAKKLGGQAAKELRGANWRPPGKVYWDAVEAVGVEEPGALDVRVFLSTPAPLGEASAADWASLFAPLQESEFESVSWEC